MRTPEEIREANRIAALKYYRDPKNKVKHKEYYDKIKNTDKFKRRIKNQRLMMYYGITLEEFEKMLTNQNNVCSLCGLAFESDKDAVVDHNHSTEKIRGIIHRKCNAALGLLDDDVEKLRKAVLYLETQDVKARNISNL